MMVGYRDTNYSHWHLRNIQENLRRNTEKKCRIHNAGVAGCAEALLIPAE